MACFDVYANPFAVERSHTPYVLDIQNDHLGSIGSRVVIALRTPRGFGTPARDLNPLLDIDGKSVVLDTASIASVAATMLKRRLACADRYRDDIMSALDTLFGAY